ncbi:hypothetical protein GGF31_009009 [Allomyces arbusculus]|nr:hypothetical protein GGF31_009009 [Allomyces arbusculus]
MHDNDDDDTMRDDDVPAPPPPPPPSQWIYTSVALWQAPPESSSKSTNRADIPDEDDGDDELLPPAPPARSRAVPPRPIKSPHAAAVHSPVLRTPHAVIVLSDTDGSDDDNHVPSARPAPPPPRRPPRVPRMSAVEAADEELARQLQAEWDMMDAAEAAAAGSSSSRMDDEALARRLQANDEELARQLQAEWAASAASSSATAAGSSAMAYPLPAPSPATPHAVAPPPRMSASPTKPDDVAAIIAKTTPDSRIAFADEGPLLKLHERFMYYNHRYFGGKLSACEVRWSPRMTLCAGQCHYRPQEGYCSVRLSVPLLQYRPKQDGIDTLLHEMIHAYLFVTDGNDDHDGHGPAFHEWMRKLNELEPGAKISVFHTFRDEVNAARKHVWKCNGPCKDRPPYFGIVRRSMNRAPQPADRWWAEHQRTCGGTYTKIQGPDIDANGNPIPPKPPASKRARKSDPTSLPGEGRRLGMAGDEDDPDPPPPPPAKRARTTKPKPAAAANDDGKQKLLDRYLRPSDPTSPGIFMAQPPTRSMPGSVTPPSSPSYGPPGSSPLKEEAGAKTQAERAPRTPKTPAPRARGAAGRRKKGAAAAAADGVAAVANGGAPMVPPVSAAAIGGPIQGPLVGPAALPADGGGARPVPPLLPGMMGGAYDAPAVPAPPAPPRLMRPAFVDLTWSEEDED